MRRQIRGLTQASANAQDGISMVQIAEGALNEVHEMLHRMNELCVKAANDTMTYEDRSYIQDEIGALSDELDRVGETTTFNTIKLFDGLPQTKATAVAGSFTVNGASSGSVTQATDEEDAYLTMNPLQNGDVVGIPDTDTGTTVYYKVATDADISAYQTEWAEYWERKAEYDADPTAEGATEPTRPVERDGSSSDTAQLTKTSDVLRMISRNIAQNNANANADLCESASSSYSLGNDGKFNIHFYGPLPVNLQVGAEKDQYISFKIHSTNSATLGVYDINVKDSDGSGAAEGIEKVKDAISINSKRRAELGAVQNRLEHTIKNLDNIVENTTYAESRIRDTDMAKQMVEYARNNILAQVGQSVIAQANQTNQGVLSLIGR